MTTHAVRLWKDSWMLCLRFILGFGSPPPPPPPPRTSDVLTGFTDCSAATVIECRLGTNEGFFSRGSHHSQFALDIFRRGLQLFLPYFYYFVTYLFINLWQNLFKTESADETSLPCLLWRDGLGRSRRVVESRRGEIAIWRHLWSSGKEREGTQGRSVNLWRGIGAELMLRAQSGRNLDVLMA